MAEPPRNWESSNLLDDVDSPSVGRHPSFAFSRNESLREDVPQRQDTMRESSRQPRPYAAQGPQINNSRLNSAARRLVIAIDYGTTFTGLAYANVSGTDFRLKDIVVQQEWSTAMGNQQKVPSVISYARPVEGKAQWGSNISENAVTMIATKLKLEPQASRFDELDMTLQALSQMGLLTFKHIRKVGSDPEFTPRTPIQIIGDYLTKILACARRDLGIDDLHTTKTSVDIIVTAPVGWSYQAHDALFKALQAAGFNRTTFPTLKDTVLLSEPEAASYFTARAERDRGSEFLKENECFVLCDAGGGTVDVVSLQVSRLKPNLVLEKATEPVGARCGSSLIDHAFKEWLRKAIGRDNYGKIDPKNAGTKRISSHVGETGVMRSLIKQFSDRKVVFSMSPKDDVKLDLPAPLNGLNIEGRVREGELVISWAEMKSLMDSCVGKVIKLIKDQIKDVSDTKNRRVKNVFLVGGFGASPYLQHQVKEMLDLDRSVRRKMRRPDQFESLTAVVQGAAIYGIEKSRHNQVKILSAITRSYGILLLKDGEWVFDWLVRTGDLIPPAGQHVCKSSIFYFPTRSNQSNEFGIYTYVPSEDDDLENEPRRWHDGQTEVEQVGRVTWSVPDNEHPGLLVPGYLESEMSGHTLAGPLCWQFTFSAKGIRADLLKAGTSLGSCDVAFAANQPRAANGANGHDSDEEWW